ncbi:S-layer homology domain-containing protein [Domibacillus mangrovi]|uniref:S-layer protein n=1 Tax=Domibacillus mangrovi TaxID=1714354 RepID=A0A1Q5P5Y5_9BACI|nr:S-layer homology domain-containing protein [Domibacillus mangrovi]OKL37637.1 hypothetical protein BLL40_04880 [Domibacillus mangrovi]
MAYQPKSYRKFVATAATATLVATAVAPAFAASSFTDVPAKYEQAVNYLVENNITLGKTATTFGTNETITRVDAAVMIAKALELDTSNAPDSGFTDVPARAKAYVDALKAAGFINGKTATTFGSDQEITRGEMAIIIARAYELTGDASKLSFTDVADRYKDAVAALVDNGITSGATATTFGTTAAIKRGDFAIFAYRVETKDELAVSNVAAVTTDAKTTVTATVKNAEANATAKVEIFANGGTTAAETKTATVVDGKVTADFTGLAAGTHVAKVTVGEASAQASFTVVASATPQVESVMAINAKEVKVVFNKVVDKTTAENVANYTLKLNGLPFGGTLVADLQADGKTVLLSDSVAADIFTNGDYYTLEVKEVLTKDLNKVTAYKSGTLNYFDNSAPTVVSSELNGSNVRVYFNEPVSGVNLKVDGGVLSGALTSTNQDGKYYVEIPASADDKKVGTHSVIAYNAVDADGNTLSVAATEYTVVSDTAAPSITSVTADSSNTFKVKVSEKLAVAPTFEVKKGGVAFIDATNTATQVALDSEDPTDLTYIVTLPATDISTAYPLYATNENTAAFSVKITNIKDNSNLAGADYNGSVTLTKDAVGPKVLSANTNTIDALGVIKVKFDENVSATVDATKVKVYKDGVLLAVTPSALGTDKFLSIALPAAEVGKLATYSVQLEAGAVKDASGNDNLALSTSATYAVTSDIAPTVTSAGANKYQVAFASTTDMTDSATTVSNYTLDGKALPNGSTVDFSGDKKTVLITLPSESVTTTTSGSLQISKNVVNKADQKVADASGNAFTQLVGLVDNVKPVLKSGKFVDADDNKLAESVELTFSENVTASNIDDFEFIVNGAKVTPASVAITSGKAVVSFIAANQINVAQTLTVKVVPANEQTVKVMDTVDADTNKLTEGTTITVNTVK